MNAVTRKDVEKLFTKETESVAGKYGEKFKNEQEAIGTLLSEWNEAKNNYMEAQLYYNCIEEKIVKHEDPEQECMQLIETVAETIQELTQVGAVCFKILKGYKGEKNAQD